MLFLNSETCYEFSRLPDLPRRFREYNIKRVIIKFIKVLRHNSQEYTVSIASVELRVVLTVQATCSLLQTAPYTLSICSKQTLVPKYRAQKAKMTKMEIKRSW